MKCHQCGFELPEIAKFCLSCGAKQEQTLAAETERSDIHPHAATPPLSSTSPPQTALDESQASLAEFPTPAPIDAPPISEIAPQATSSVEIPSTVSQAQPAEPAPQLAPSALRSKTIIYAVIGVFVIVVLCGLGYWKWAQKKAIDEQSAHIVKQQAEEQKRKADEEQQRKLKEAEEKGHKEAEETAKEETSEKTRKEGETPENCVEREMAKWEMLRTKEISEWCDNLAKKGKECKISVGAEEAVTEEALNRIAVQCR